MPRRILAKVLSHREVSPSYWHLTMQNDYIAQNSFAGQFVHLLPRAYNLSDPLLRRAFSIMNTQEDRFEILYRAGGKGTSNMTLFAENDDVDVIAPLGQPFESIDKPVVLVGGGVGVPPLAMLSRQRFLANYRSATQVILGARSRADILCLENFSLCEIEPRVVTEDGSMGRTGFVTLLLEELLEQDETIESVQACGPWPMLRAVAELCTQKKVSCQISMEENMPCGIGVCNGCVVKMNEGEDEYSMYRRVCVDGPVMWAHEVDWNGQG